MVPGSFAAITRLLQDADIFLARPGRVGMIIASPFYEKKNEK
jgi:hypothetical protein